MDKEDKEDVVYIYIYIYTHTHTYTHNGILLSHKMNEILPFAARWMDIDNIILSEMSDKDKYCMIPLICGV